MARFAPLFTAAACGLTALPGYADTAWDDISYQLYGDRALLSSGDVIALDAPYRTDNDARTRLAAQIRAPQGHLVTEVTLVLDENPMPVSAVFRFEDPQPRFRFDATMRINGPTPLHVVAELDDGRLFVAEGFVKTSGQGACAAPPGTDPKEALATLGNMTLALGPEMGEGKGLVKRLSALAAQLHRLDIDIDHPSHSGMQMDQLSLLYIPMRYVENLKVDLDGGSYVDITGSISLSENPHLSLSVPEAAQRADVTMTDTDGTTTHASTTLGGY